MNTKFNRTTYLTWVLIFGFFASLTGCGWLDRELNGQIFIVQKNGESIKLGLVDLYSISEEDLQAHFLKKYQEGEISKEKMKARYTISKSKIDGANKAVVELKKSIAKGADLIKEGIYSGELEKNPVKTRQIIAIFKEMENTILPMAEAEAAKIAAAEQGVVNEYEAIDKPGYYFNGIPRMNALGKTDADGKFSVRVPRGDMVIVARGERMVFGTSEKYHWAVKLNSIDLKKHVYLSNDNLIETRCSSCMLTSVK